MSFCSSEVSGISCGQVISLGSPVQYLLIYKVLYSTSDFPNGSKSKIKDLSSFSSLTSLLEVRISEDFFLTSSSKSLTSIAEVRIFC
ncbi:hypothetical protein COI_2727 [Mannheimia haemolytica serotype A2 str. OVINE]|nr:hypothetical protein COI_2727 [Mannheimia haemolytica serotype A2 str. OVINE]